LELCFRRPHSQQSIAIGAREIAAADGIPELSEKHFDLLKYLRDEFENNNGNQPNERNMVKAMSELWGGKISTKELYDLFPKQPSSRLVAVSICTSIRAASRYRPRSLCTGSQAWTFAAKADWSLRRHPCSRTGQVSTLGK